MTTADIAGGGSGGGKDADVVAALMRGDQHLFAHLVDAWSPAMMRLARFHVANHQGAEDCVQEAWMAALRGLANFEGRSSLRTWVIGIVLNIARRQGTRERRQIPDASLSGGPTVDPERFQGPDERYPGGWRQFPNPWPSPEDSAVSQEMVTLVYAALDKLPERQRAVMELRDVHGYDGQEVANILNLSPGNQRILLHRARAGIRRELETYFASRT